MSHEHGPPSVDLDSVRTILRVLGALVLIFVMIDVVWFGPSWIASLGQDSHQGPEPTAAEGEHSPPPNKDIEPPPKAAEHGTADDYGTAQEHGTADDHGTAQEHGAATFGGHKHGHFAFEMMPTFHALYGFAGCVLLVLAARVLRTLVMRDEDYYGDDAPLDPQEDAHV